MNVKNLDSDWIRKESGEKVIYYGYAENGTRPSESKWAIRMVENSGGSQSVQWSGTLQRPNSKWKDKEFYFKSSLSANKWDLSFTHSTTLSPNTFISLYNVGLSWNEVPGAHTYMINLSSDSGTFYNSSGQHLKSSEFIEETPKNAFNFKSELGVKYKLKVTAVSKSGSGTLDAEPYNLTVTHPSPKKKKK